MKRNAITMASSLLACVLAAGTSSAQTPTAHLVLAADNGNYQRQQEFGAGGQVVLDANVADLAIRKGEAGTLRLSIDPGDHGQQDVASWVREFSVSKQYAKIHLDLPKHNGGSSSPHVTLYVPEQTSVRLSVSVGNVGIDALNGNVEADIGVGNLGVGTLDASKYHDVAVSVGMGNITDRALNMGTSGMFGKDASYHGDGALKMKLHAKLGNIELDKGGPKGDFAGK